VAEKCVGIQESLGNFREVAADHGRSAGILMEAGRYNEADTRYDLALTTARQAGDKELEGAFLQHQGLLARRRNQLNRATRLYQQALESFREAGNQGAMMRSYTHLV
jgi:tetratricopeptide (TPR) repeat protein